MKPPKVTEQMLEGLANVFAGALNGDVDPKRGAVAIKAALVTTELIHAENRAALIAHQLGRVPFQFGKLPLGPETPSK